MKKIVQTLVLIALMATACNAAPPTDVPMATDQNTPAVVGTAIDNTYIEKDGVEVIYFAGGFL